MTTLLGKCTFVVAMGVCGVFASAKAEPASSNYHKISNLQAENSLYTVDKLTERDAIFKMINDFKINHQIKAQLTEYKRDSGFITKLGMKFTSATGTVTQLNQSQETGINALCIEVDLWTHEIVKSGNCQTATVSSPQEISAATQERAAAYRTRVVTAQEKAALRLQQQREENQIAIMERKQEIAAKMEASRQRTDSIAQQQSLARAAQLEALDLKNKERLEALEAARLDKIEQEKQEIEAQTAQLESQVAQERERLQTLEDQKEIVRREGLLQKERMQQELLNRQTRRDSLRLATNTDKLRLLTIERVRLAKAQEERNRIIKQKTELEAQRLEKESQLKALVVARQASEQVIKLRKEQNDLRAQIIVLEQQRLEKENILAQPLVNEDFLFEGYLYFNADQIYYKAVASQTYVFNTVGRMLFVLDKALAPGLQNGTLQLQGKPHTYTVKNGVLTLYNESQQSVNENGELSQTATRMESAPASRRDFTVTKEFVITATATVESMEKLAKDLAALGHEFQLYDFETTANGGMSKVIFSIDDSQYAFQLPDGIPTVVIQYDAQLDSLRVKAVS